MIQKIQLRGISRSPSDRMTEDGGCAESFNVITDNAEIAPMPEPQDITEAAGLPTNESFEVLYIHKGSGYTNYICRRGNEIGIYGSVKWEMPEDLKDKKWAYPEDLVGPISETSSGDYSVRIDTVYYEGTPEYVLGGYEKGDYYKVTEITGGSQTEMECALKYVGVSMTTDTFEPFVTLNETDMIDNFCAIGNVFFCTVNGELNYFLFIDGKYEKTVSGMIEMPDFNVHNIIGQRVVSNSVQIDVTLWDEAASTTPEVILSDDKLRKAVREDVLNNWGAGSLRFVRFSLVLYNGDEIYGAPMLFKSLDAKVYDFRWVGIRYVHRTSTSASSSWYIKTEYSYLSETDNGFFIRLGNYNDILSLKNIITAVRLYSTSTIDNNSDNSALDWDTSQSTDVLDYFCVEVGGTPDMKTDVEVSSNHLVHKYEKKNVREKLKNIVDFRLVREYKFDMDYVDVDTVNVPMDRLKDGDTITFPTDDVLETRLELNTELEYVPERLNVHKLITYNQRLYAMAGSQKETARLPFSVASASDFVGSPVDSYTFAFKITNPTTGESYIRVPKDDGVIWFTPEDSRYLPFLSYPDSNCEKAYIGIRDASGKATTYEIDMKPWASVVGYSYAIIDPTMSKTLGDALRDLDTGKVRQLPTESVQAAIYDKLFVSEAQNPFIFPHSYSFGADVLGAATTTKALSTGQFGQFPLYVFTTDGIWAMEIAADGSFVSKKPLSRDVALSNGCITPIEQAIVFTTDKGVMMLTGSDIQNISPNMLGKHYSMDTKLQGVIDGSPFRGVVSNDNAAFMDFMRNVQCAYDYTGQRLLFFNNEKEYQYVYKINTATWHKTSVVIPKHNSAHILNSYPDCYIATYEPDEYSRLWNLSATLETDGATPMKGMIITRPFDLGYPDVRKVIKSIRIRGYYNRQDVKYILQGSMDGLNWGILPSLHSGSFKLFRLIIMADLGKDERISWVDVDFDVRFNNRLR